MKAAGERPRIGHLHRDALQPDQLAGRFQARGRIADEIAAKQGQRPVVVCDNTLLGPVFQRPLDHGVDVSVYSLTKYVGGHSDLIAGAALGSKAVTKSIKALRGGDRHAARSALVLDARPLAGNAEHSHGESQRQRPHRRRIPGRAPEGRKGGLSAVPRRRHSGRRRIQDAMHGRRDRRSRSTFAVARPRRSRSSTRLQILKLAVSLGGTESLASHPAAMTHSGVPKDVRERIGVSDATIRLSIGVEHPDDLVADLTQALVAS